MPCRPAVTAALLAALLLGGCQGTPERPVPASQPSAEESGHAHVAAQAAAVAVALAFMLDRLPPTAVLLIGEQHDAPAHQTLQAQAVRHLADRGALAALVLEMADRGRATDGLARDASEAAVREALAWSDAAWPWAAYGPAVMAAVRAGVPVRGGNMPRSANAASQADESLDRTLTPQALRRLRRLVDEGHCGLLPAARVPALTRIQIARDRAMAETVTQALRPGSTVVLLAGQTHVSRALGVPRHLASDAAARVLWLAAGSGRPADGDLAEGDSLLPTPPTPPVDACAGLRQRLPAASAVQRP